MTNLNPLEIKNVVQQAFAVKTPEGLRWDYQKMYLFILEHEKLKRNAHVRARQNEEKVQKFVESQSMTTTKQVAQKFNIVVGYASEILKRLASSGRIRKVQKGIYMGIKYYSSVEK